MNELIPAPSNSLATRSLVKMFLSGRKPTTLAAYRADVDDFAKFLGAANPDDAARRLLEAGHGNANALALAYRSRLLERGLSPATVNRRLAAIRSLVKLARTLGVVSFDLEVEGVKSTSFRDTRGPGLEGVRQILAELVRRTDPKSFRDLALVRMMFDLGLRRAEVVGLDLEHLDLVSGVVEILGKGRSQRERLTLPSATIAALSDWVAVRGTDAGPLFSSLDRASRGHRLTGRAIHKIVGRLGADVGLEVRPHGLRHAAITAALEVTQGDVRRAQRFSRHRDLRTLTIYDDARRDMAGEVASLVSLSIKGAAT